MKIVVVLIVVGLALSEGRGLLGKFAEEAYIATAGEYGEFRYYVVPKFQSRQCAEEDHWQKASVSLIVQGSLKNLKYLDLMLERWEGPIELVVFLENYDDEAQILTKFLGILSDCTDRFSCQVSVHVVVYVTDNNFSFLSEFFEQEAEIHTESSVCELNQCLDAKQRAKELLPKGQNFLWSRDNGPVFPPNLLRNVGRNQSNTTHHLLLDADIIPSSGLYQSLQKLLKFPLGHFSDGDILSDELHDGNGSKDLEGSFRRVGLILPVFETDLSNCEESNGLPTTKEELVEKILDKNSSLAPFYEAVNPRVQGLTNFKKWIRIKGEADFSRQKISVIDRDLSVAYWIDWADPYEPFMVLHRSAPIYDQRFVQYGVNRLSQTCEMHIAGWEFAVLDPGFLIHCGRKSPAEFHPTKALELAKNQRLYKGAFLTEVLAMYSSSERSC